MKICQIVASSGFGGLEKHVVELSNELSKNEEVTLVAPADLREFVSETVHFIPFDFNRSRYNPLMLWDLWRLIKQGDFDIVHAQANKAVSLLSKLSGLIAAKAVGTIHNSKKNKGRVFKNIAHVIAVSEEAGRRINDIPVTVIYNGIQPNLQIPAFTREQLIDEFNLSDEKPLLCSVGRLVKAKGFDLLIEAMREVDANLIIVGDGELKAELQQKIDASGLNDRVKLAGHRSEVLSILKGIDGMIISSRNEGFSYVLVEALVSKVPVLSTDVSAKEFLPSCLVMSKSADSIRQKMNEYVFSAEDWLKQMQPVFSRAEKELTLTAMAEKTRSVYESLLKK